MSGDVYSKTHKRISELTKFSEPAGVDPLNSLMTPSGAGRWAFPADSVDGTVNNTLRIPGNRISFLSQDGKVLARNLPSYLSYEDTLVEYDPTDIPGDINTVYFDVDGDIITFYRWVQSEPYDASDPSDPHGRYVPIANNLKVVDGEGTVVQDTPATSSAMPVRKISLNIGTSATDTGNDVLFIGSADHKLKHAKTNVSAGTYPSQQPGGIGFGGSIVIPFVGVNGTGHVRTASTTTVTFPRTTAGSSKQGITKISADNPQPIGSRASPGGNLSFVSAADHVHTASSLTMNNIDGTPTYAMWGLCEVNFNNILHASLPAAPGGSMRLLSASVSGQQATTSWKIGRRVFDSDTKTLIPDVSRQFIGTSGAQIWSFSDLNVNSLYAVDLQFEIVVTASPGAGSPHALPDLRPVTVTVGDMVRTFNVDASRYYSIQNGADFPMYVSLSGMVHTGASQSTVPISIAFEPTNEPIFSVKLYRGVATLLYRNVPSGN